jgi:predicted RNA-binding Zn-ribbon protein involved in translation (DUF1610 family)
MAGEGKCPKCGKAITRLRLASIPSSIEGQKKDFPTAIFMCPSCNAVLGAQIDPVAVMSGTVKGVAKALTSVRPKQ